MSLYYVGAFHILQKISGYEMWTRISTSASHGPKLTDGPLDFGVQSDPLPLFPSPIPNLLLLMFLLSSKLLYNEDAEYPQPKINRELKVEIQKFSAKQLKFTLS